MKSMDEDRTETFISIVASCLDKNLLMDDIISMLQDSKFSPDEIFLIVKAGEIIHKYRVQEPKKKGSFKRSE
jgi:hypothetical protein